MTPGELETLKVVLIEDDEDDYLIIRELLEGAPGGFEIEWMSAYAEGEAALADQVGDVYLIDYRLGAQSGIDLIRAARRQGCGGALILLTGQADAEIDYEALQAGADDYLPKRGLTSEALGRAVRYGLERRRLVERVGSLARLEQVAVLAGGAAHDYNNLLLAIAGNVDLALMHIPEDNPAHKRVLEIKSAAERASALTRRLLSYSGQGSSFRERLEIRKVIDDSLLLVEKTHGESPVTVAPADVRATVEGDYGELVQLFAGLVTNAVEASEDGSARLIDVRLTAGAEVVSVDVVDRGSGMAAETRRRAFDPFFSTKALGRGLGLAAARGIVASHGGDVEIRSTLGEGTTVRVSLPVAR